MLLAALCLTGCFAGTGSHPTGPVTKNGVMGQNDLWHSAGGEACGWSTRSQPLGGVVNPIATGPVGPGPRYASLAAGDTVFDTSGCAPWVQAGGPFDRLNPISIYGVMLGDGDYLVGAEIPTGTYRATAPATCHWQRVRNFRTNQSFSDAIFPDPVIENSSADTVTIAPGDFGFSSYACGAWIGTG